jgi:hypothetical protein
MKKTIRLRKKEMFANVMKKPINKANKAPDELRLFLLSPLEKS